MDFSLKLNKALYVNFPIVNILNVDYNKKGKILLI